MSGTAPAALASIAEAARLLAWLAFLLAVLSNMSADSAARRATGAGVVAAFTIAAGLAAVDILALGPRPAYIVQLIGAVFALVCLEQVYRNTPAEGRWALKFIAVALLALFGFDLFMLTEALLFGRLNPSFWTARGFANALMVPLLAVAAARNPQWRFDINVSRQVVFHSATLFAAGAFLLVMSLAGYWVRWFGGEWGVAAQTVVVFIAAVAAMVAMLSGKLRARLRVFLAKNFFSYRYDYRAEWLKLTQLLTDSPAAADQGTAAPQDPLEIRALRGLAALVESNGGALWLSGDHGDLVCAGRWNIRGETPTLPADAPLITFLRESQWVINLPEWRTHPDRYAELSLPAVIADSESNWLIVPLMLHEDLLGFALLTRPMAPTIVDWEVRDTLKAAARQVASYLAVRRAVESLVQARQFESFNRMSAFVVHDLKNLVAQLSLLMANAARHRDNPEFQQDMLDTVENVLARMQGLLLQLRAGTRPVEPPGLVSLIDAIEAAIHAKRGLQPRPTLEIDPRLRHAAVLAHRDRLERVIGHLIQNAAEATPDEGSIQVRVVRQDGHARIDVEDTGCGMSDQFIREQLFRPFDSSKEHGMGIGAFESREYVREIGGSLDVESRENTGTLFRIRLPLATAAGGETD